MSVDWYPGIKDFCTHWEDAPMLQHTFKTLEREFADDSDASIDAAKAIVECACRVIIENLDDPKNPKKPKETHPNFGSWVKAAVIVLKLDEVRDNTFQKLVSQYHKLTTALGDLRNNAGPVSHGKDGFIKILTTHQRRSALLAADAIVTFLHHAYLGHEPDPVLTREPYERFPKSNALIDRYALVTANFDEDEGSLSLEVFSPSGDQIPLIVEPSRLLFSIDREAYKQVLSACREEDSLDSDGK